jgi:hypothetical protein
LLCALAFLFCSCSEKDSTDRRESEARPQSPVRFYREYVTVEPAPDLTRVSALYYFRNGSDEAIEQAISYPFPVDRFHQYPRIVRVWEVTEKGLRPMGFSPRRRSVLWMMRFGPREEKIVRVDYTQDISRPRAVYIVTTTKHWQRPIELAEFEFRVPSTLDSVRLSFEPDTTSVSGDTMVYYMRREQFMPDEDLVVTWSE